MQSTNMIRAAKIGYIVLSITICVLGIVMILSPGDSVAILGRLIGIVLILFGIVRIIGYLSKDLYRLAFQHDLALGILSIALGSIIVLRRNWAINGLSIMLGVETIIGALLKLQTALDAKVFGLNTWWLILLMAILANAAGIALIAFPQESMIHMMRWIGITMLTEGILDLCVVLCAVRVASHRQADIIS